jgi:hypothetical protein
MQNFKNQEAKKRNMNPNIKFQLTKKILFKKKNITQSKIILKNLSQIWQANESKSNLFS